MKVTTCCQKRFYASWHLFYKSLQEGTHIIQKIYPLFGVLGWGLVTVKAVAYDSHSFCMFCMFQFFITV